MCGLKPLTFDDVIDACDVTPCVGVWIETFYYINACKALCVTPCVGVWIETWDVEKKKYTEVSHTLRGCVD